MIHIVHNFKAKTPIWGQRGRTSKIGELPKAGKLLTFEAETLSKGGEPNFEKTIVLQEEVLRMFVFSFSMKQLQACKLGRCNSYIHT